MQELHQLWTLGAGELIMIIIVALFIFGPKRLPEIGKALGDGLSSFRDASRDKSKSLPSEK